MSADSRNGRLVPSNTPSERLALGLLATCVRDNGDPQRALELLAPVQLKQKRTLDHAMIQQ